MKKTIAFLVLVLMIFTMCSCAAEEGSAPDYTKLDVKDDWDGLEFTIVQTSLADATYLYYKLDTMLADSALERVKEVENKHNIKITLKGYNEDDTFKNLLNMTLVTGDPLGDILFSEASMLRDFANAGGLTPIENVAEQIDIYDFDKWGEPNVWEFMMCKGKMYGVVPVSWVGNAPYVFYPIVFNGDIVRRFGLGDLREYYENGEWTREKMLEVIVQCTDDTLASPIKGMGAAWMHLIRAVLLNNGIEFVTFSEDLSSYSCGWVSEAGIEALTWLKDVNENYADYFLAADFSGNWGFTDLFNEEKCALAMTSSDRIMDSIAYEIDNFGLLPFPVGPYGTYGQWAGFYESARNLCIPAYVDFPAEAATIIDEIFEPMEEYPTKASIDEYYNKLIFSDPRDVELLNIMGSNCKYSFWPDGGDNVLNNIKSNLMSTTPTEILEKSGSLSDKCIIEQMIPSILETQRLLDEMPAK